MAAIRRTCRLSTLSPVKTVGPDPLVKSNPASTASPRRPTGSTPHPQTASRSRWSSGSTSTGAFNGARQGPVDGRGHTPIAFMPSAAITQVRDGKLRALAVLSDKRANALPDVPTATEAGIPGHEGDTLTGLVAPTGTPREIVEKLYAEIRKMVALPDVKERLEALGFNPVANRPEEFGERIRTESARWAKVIVSEDPSSEDYRYAVGAQHQRLGIETQGPAVLRLTTAPLGHLLEWNHAGRRLSLDRRACPSGRAPRVPPEDMRPPASAMEHAKIAGRRFLKRATVPPGDDDRCSNDATHRPHFLAAAAQLEAPLRGCRPERARCPTDGLCPAAPAKPQLRLRCPNSGRARPASARERLL